jgi:hypothetical protein
MEELDKAIKSAKHIAYCVLRIGSIIFKVYESLALPNLLFDQH